MNSDRDARARSINSQSAIRNPKSDMPDGLGTIGRYLIVFGAVIVVIGVIMMMAGKFPGLRIGRLPGDIYVERGNWRFYFPLVTSILLSLILTFILWLINRR
jgi:Protein of unknown function (DUF2905)